MTIESGLRERKKAAARAAMSQAAWSLMLQRGLAAVSAEAVAEAAGVSPRTFRNYFASREEAVLEELVQRHIALAERIRARPAGETLWESLDRVLPEGVRDIVADRDDYVTLVRHMQHSRAMLAQSLLVIDQGRAILTEVVAQRTGTDPARDVLPRLLAGAVGAVLSASIDLWVRGDGHASLPDLIRECLGQLRAGFPTAAA